MVVEETEAAERTEVEAGVMLEEEVRVSDFLRDDRTGAGACTRGEGLSWEASDGGRGGRWWRATGLRWGVRDMWRPMAICSMVGRADETSGKRDWDGVKATRGFESSGWRDA